MKNEKWDVARVRKSGGPFLRWFRYARILRKIGVDADMVIAFSSVSVGVPLWLSRLKNPKRYLRLGGDFIWERYTDRGGLLGLKKFYEKIGYYSLFTIHYSLFKWFMGKLLRSFNNVIFSTRFQEEIYEQHYDRLPSHSVLENAIPAGTPMRHTSGGALKLLFMGRFVGFKNLSVLLEAIAIQHNTPLRDRVTLTFVGDGPMKKRLQLQANKLGVHRSVHFLPPLHGDDKKKVFKEHDLLIIPSITEISPNVALEARSNGLPVLLTTDTGLSETLTQGMFLRNLSSPQAIATALQEVHHLYPRLAEDAAIEPVKRGWKEVAENWLELIEQ